MSRSRTTANGRRAERSAPEGRGLERLFDKLPPHAIEAEMSLLGSMILAGTEDVDRIADVVQIVRDPAAFFLPKHALIYEAIARLYDRSQSIDAVQLRQQLADAGKLDAVGGIDYLIELAESVPTSINATHYAEIVAGKAKLRRLIEAAAHVLRDAHESHDGADAVADRAERWWSEATDDPARLIVRDANELIRERADARARGVKPDPGLLTPWHDLNAVIGGMRGGELLVIGARPSHGKSALALGIADHLVAVEHKGVAFVTLEMGSAELCDRLDAWRADVALERVRSGRLNEHEQAALAGAADEARAYAPLLLLERIGEGTLLDVRAGARRMVRQGAVLLVIDYMQLMSTAGAENRFQGVSEISRGLKGLAMELHVPVLALSQLNRKSEDRQDKRPTLADLRESGQIEQDADVVMLLHREDAARTGDRRYEPDHRAEIIVAKQRNGPTGLVKLRFSGRLAAFEPLAAGEYA